MEVEVVEKGERMVGSGAGRGLGKEWRKGRGGGGLKMKLAAAILLPALVRSELIELNRYRFPLRINFGDKGQWLNRL